MARRDGGFTLIEALVATAVFALVLSALYQGIAIGWRGLKKAGAEDTARAVLSQHLASSGVETPLQAATTNGTTDGVAWHAEIRPYRDTSLNAGETPPQAYQGFWIIVTVRWREGRFSPEHALQATTLKIKRAS